jgi:hypothetical protein
MLGPGCSFDEATHAYQRNGLAVLSVTRALEFAGLTNYEGVRQEVLERRSLIGRYVHSATHYYDEGVLDWNSYQDDNPHDQEMKARVQAWAKFRKETGFTPRLCEEAFIANVNGMVYGLTPDRLGDIHGNECVLDIKTSAVLQPWYGIQIAAYAMGIPCSDLFSPRARFCARRRMVVQLLPNGDYKKRDYTDPVDADVFLAALLVATWKMEHGTKVKEIALD